MKSEPPRVAVVAGFPPEGGFGGGVILRSLLDDYPSERLLWIALKREQAEAWWRPEVVRVLTGLSFRGQRFIPRKLQAALARFESRVAAKVALASIRRWQADAVWMVLDYFVIHTLRAIARAAPVNVHVSVHDDPAISAETCGSVFSRNDVAEAFRECYTTARSRDCISARLCKKYKQEFGLDSFVIARGIDTREWALRISQRPPNAGRVVKIIMGGAGGARDRAWPANLLAGIEMFRDDAKRRVEFHAFDRFFPGRADWCTVHAPLPEPDYNAFLVSMDIGYAHDSTDDVGVRFAQTSFPTKIVTYLAAGVPFVYHGPRDSTVGDLLAQYRAGVIVESQEPARLAQAFSNVLDEHEQMRQECLRAARERFDAQTFRTKLEQTFVELANGPVKRDYDGKRSGGLPF